MASQASKYIYIVSGLPRSGTSMACRMLEAAGIPMVSDGLRKKDRHNPLGYFELEKVKRLKEDAAWVPGCKGRGLKVISHLLCYLPGGCTYKVVFMLRPLGQVIASQNKMLASKQKPYDPADTPFFISKFQDHLHEVRLWMDEAPNMDTLFLDYPQVIAQPQKQSGLLADFIARPQAAQAMAGSVDPSLFRNQ